MTMGYDGARDTTLPLSISLDFLQSHLRDNDAANARLSSRFMKRIADIAELKNIIDALSSYRGYDSQILVDHVPSISGYITTENTKVNDFIQIWGACDTDQLSRQASTGLRAVYAAVATPAIKDTQDNHGEEPSSSRIALKRV
jgi:hypothetical protein